MARISPGHPSSRALRRTAALAVAAGTLAVLNPAPVAAYPDGTDLHYPVIDEAWELNLGTTFQYSSPTVADVDGDGRNDIVLAGHDGMLRVLRADGSTIWEAPVIPPSAGGPVGVDSTPTVVDLDRDGRVEIVVGAGTFNVQGQQGGLVVFDSAGHVRWKWEGGDIFNLWTMAAGGDGYREPAQSTTAVGDVNGDGRLDVVFGAMDNRVHVLDGATGQEVAGWTDSSGGPGYWVDDSMWSSIAVADVDGDGRAEVFAGVAATPGGTVSHAGGVLMRLDLEGGVNLTWARFYGEPVNSSPAVGDLTGDGRPEIVVGLGNENGTADETKVIAVDSANGADAPGWPQQTNGVTFSSPALGDLDGDGRLDVAIGTMPGNLDGRVYTFRGDGSVLWERTPNDAATGEPGGVIVGSPMIADVNGDGRQDVTIGHGWAMYSLDGPTGNRFYAAVDKGNTYQNAPAVADFGPGVGWLMINASMMGRVGAYHIPPPGQTPDWPNWRGSYRHTGRPATDEPPCPDAPEPTGAPDVDASTFHPLPPTRVLDTRAGLGAERMPLGGGCTLGLTVTGGDSGVPGNAAAVVLNVTAVDSRGSGYLTVYPCGQNPPNASNLNFVAGQTVPNAVKVPVGVDGKVCFTSLVAIDIVADVSGWYGGNGGARYAPLAPARVLDTRTGIGAPAGKVPGEGVVTLAVTGAGGVPASGVSAVALNVTVTEPDGAGFLTVYPCGPRPLASNLNFLPGQNVPNHVIVPVAGDGTVCFSGNVATHVLADVAGWYGDDGAPFVPLAPSRILDTRDGTGIGTPTRVNPGSILELPVLGRNGIPGEDVEAVSLNVTATAPSGPGFVTVFPCGQTPPNASSLNYTAGSNVPNLVTAAVGTGGKVCFTSYAPTDLIADVAGYFAG